MNKFILFLVLVSCAHVRQTQSESGSQIEEVRPPFPGYLYQPKNTSKAPAILMLHGSLGGNGNFWYPKGQEPKDTGDQALVPKLARYFASRGYITYALCYFDCKHHSNYSSYPPDELANVDILNVIIKAYLWLQNEHPQANGKIGLYGVSRGAELALLTATELNTLTQANSKIKPPLITIALSPSSMVVGSFPLSVAQGTSEGQPADFSKGKNIPAWLLDSKPYSTGQKINISQYKMPFLISYFNQDSVWSKFINPLDLYEQVKQNSTVHLFSVTSNVGESEHLDFKNFPQHFLQFNKVGHVYDKRGTKEFKIQVRAVNDAMDTFLK